MIDNRFIANLATDEFNDIDRPPNLQTITQKERLAQLYQNWLYKEANRIYTEKVNHYSKIVNAKPQGIIIKNLKNRWGSLTKKHFLHLNFNLIKAPSGIIDYIIIHELLHITIKDHSHRFWEYLKRYVPDYGKKIKWLERNTIALMQQRKIST